MEAGRYQNGYEYVKMGKNTSKRKILVIPGLNNEMIRTTRYTLYLRYHYRGLKNRQIIVASRKEGLSQDITTEEMAQHYKEIIDEEGPCNILSVSMGGFIAQHLATKTDKIEKLVLGFTGQKLGKSGRTKIKDWINLLKKDKTSEFYREVAGDTFSGLKKPLYKLSSTALWKTFSRPPMEDLIACAEACLEHDTTTEASNIETDTLMIGGRNDDFFPENIISETAQRIGAETRYIDGRHAAFQQNSSEFHDEARRFFDR